MSDIQPAVGNDGEAADVVVGGSAAGFAQEIFAGSHRLSADEPQAVGGTDTGPSPYDLLLAALGSCTAGDCKSMSGPPDTDIGDRY